MYCLLFDDYAAAAAAINFDEMCVRIWFLVVTRRYLLVPSLYNLFIFISLISDI